MRPWPRSRFFLAPLMSALTFAACGDDGAGEQQFESTEQFGSVQVILNEPFCDVCDSTDKSFLLARSPVLHKVVKLIDGAKNTLDVAQFTFSQRPIADAILRAHQRGVVVRLAMDDAQDKSGTRSSELKAAGVNVRFVNGSSGGYMHAKFLVVDGETALTGSNNFSSTGVSINEENTIVLRGKNDPRLQGMRCHFEAIWADDSSKVAACSNAVAAFAPSSTARNLVRDQLQAATESIDVIMHHLTLDDTIDELIEAVEQRGVAVRVLVNEADAADYTGGDWDRLLSKGGQIRFKRGNSSTFQLLHHKLAIIDGRILVNGSGNWSAGGFFKNYENFILYEEPHVLARFRSMYHRLWNWSFDAPGATETAAQQHARTTSHFFGNLHGHFPAAANGVELDDGKAIVLDDAGVEHPVTIPENLREAAAFAYEHARQQGGLDFMALTPHCRDDLAGDTDGNMSVSGYAELRTAAANASDSGFLALAGMEWSSNSSGNHVGLLGSSEITKIERGRFDQFYGDFLQGRARSGERPFVMLNHPRTFRNDETSLKGSWDIVYGVNLLDIPSNGERSKKFNDYGLDDFAPLNQQRDSWLAGDALPDPAVVDATWETILDNAGDHIRLMEVTLNRGNEFGSHTPHNPSIVPSDEDPEVFERRTKVHTDYDYFLTRGFRIAPIASHDNHYANWGTGHTSRTVALGSSLNTRTFLDAVEFREIYASEDENLAIQFYAEQRSPMGSEHRTSQGTVDAQLWLGDPDYDGLFAVRVYQGKVGEDGVVIRQELPGMSAGWHDLSISVPDVAVHFVYLEIHEVDTDRMAWSSPIWINHLSELPDEDDDPGGDDPGGDDPGGDDPGGDDPGGDDPGGDDPGADPSGHIVINEVDYDQPDNDTGEFVELFNTSSETIDLTNLVLVGINGKNDTEYLRIDLGQAGTLAPGQYLVVGTTGVLANLPSGAASIAFPNSSNNIQNGGSDALGIVDLSSGELLDALSYEGGLTTGTVTGIGSFTFVEGTPTDVVDNAAKSLCRTPNGSDTGDAATDWIAATPSPGLANL